MKFRKGMSVKEYCQENREWLQELAQSADIVVRSMALSVLIVAGESEELDNTKRT